MAKYKVVPVARRAVGTYLDPSQVEAVMNKHAAQGWRVISVCPAQVQGGLRGGGAQEGVIVTFEMV